MGTGGSIVPKEFLLLTQCLCSETVTFMLNTFYQCTILAISRKMFLSPKRLQRQIKPVRQTETFCLGLQ